MSTSAGDVCMFCERMVRPLSCNEEFSEFRILQSDLVPTNDKLSELAHFKSIGGEMLEGQKRALFVTKRFSCDEKNSFHIPVLHEREGLENTTFTHCMYSTCKKLVSYVVVTCAAGYSV